MYTHRDGRFARIVLVAFFLIIVAYGIYESQGVLLGPTIKFDTSSAAVDSSYIVIRGRAAHIVTLSMNGATISVTEEGVFEQPYVLQPGLNHIVFDATDKYGRRRQKILEMVYVAPDKGVQDENSDNTAPKVTFASSTTASTTSQE